MANITRKELAERANVSVATVDRVLHGRAGVSARARQRVKEAILESGFGKLPASLTRYPRGQVRLLFVIPDQDTGFVTKLIEAIRLGRNAVPDADVRIDIARVNLKDDPSLHKAIGRISPEACDGIALFVHDLPGVRAEIDTLVARGIPVVTMVTDVPASRRIGFIGIDHVAAGRLAGRVMGRFLRGVSGDIAVITGVQDIRDHMERQLGFQQMIGSEYRNLRVLNPVRGDSVSARNRGLVIDLLRDYPNLVGLYSVAAGNSGIVMGLSEMRHKPRIVTVLHDLTDAARSGLSQGVVDVVIGQDTTQIGWQSVRLLCAAALGDPLPAEQPPIGFHVFFPENAY